MDEKEKQLRAELTDLQKKLAEPDIYSDPIYPKLAKRQAKLEAIIGLFDKKARLVEAHTQATSLASGNDELAELAREELAETEAALLSVDEQLAEALTPKDPNDEKDIIVEIRAGAGGDEASLFAAELYRMYTRWAR